MTKVVKKTSSKSAVKKVSTKKVAKPAATKKAATKSKTKPTTKKSPTKSNTSKPKSKPKDDIDFKLGDKVVHPAHGIGVIEKINKRMIAGIESEFYEVSILGSSLKVSVAVKFAVSDGLRKVVGEETIDEVYKILKNRQTKVDTQTWNRRIRQYQEKMVTGSIFEIASVFRDLCHLQTGKTLSYGERDMLKMAKNRLVKEISIAKELSEEDVKGELRDICHLTI